MTPEQFCYWLQGLLENKSDRDPISLKEARSIADHLATVFTKVTPEPVEKLTDEERRIRLRREEFRRRQLNEAIRQTKRIC